MRKWGLLIGVVFALLASSCDNTTTQPASKTALDALVGAAVTLQHSGNVTVTLSIANSGALGGAASGLGWYDFGSSQGSAVLKFKNQLTEPVLFAPLAIYIQPPGPGSKVVPAGSWVLVDLLDPTSNSSISAVEFTTMNAGFAAYLLAKAAVSASVVSDSSPAFAGATHYQVTVNPAYVAPPSESASATSTPIPSPTSELAFAAASLAYSNTISSGNTGSLVTPFEVWLDQSGKIKQITFDRVGSATDKVTLTFSAGTSPTPISIPSSGLTIDSASLAPPSPGASPTPAETLGLDGDAS